MVRPKEPDASAPLPLLLASDEAEDGSALQGAQAGPSTGIYELSRANGLGEAQFKAILENLPAATYVKDTSGRYLFANRRVGEIFHRSLDQIIGKTDHELLDQQTADPLRAHDLKVLSTASPLEREEVLAVAGSPRTYLSVKFPLLDTNGSVYALGGISTDITERKKAEAVLNQYAERLEILHELDRAILSSQSPRTIAQVALRHLRELVPCFRASIVLFDFERDEATVLAAVTAGRPHGRLAKGMRLPIRHLWDAELLKQGTISTVVDIQALPSVSGSMKALLSEGVRSYSSLPLSYRGELIGALDIGSDKPGGFAQQHLVAAYEIADQLAVAIQSATLFQQVQVARARLRTLSRRLIEAQENERRRIARELHDEVGQALTAVKIDLQQLQRLADGMGDRRPSNAGHLEESIAGVERALQQIRNLSLDLRPSMLDDLGLASALRWYADRQARRAGIEALTFVIGPVSERLPPEIETSCFRIAQEAITNILRHARTTSVTIELRQEGTELELIIADTGVGFDVRAAQEEAARGGSIGILGMQERAELAGGTLSIESRPGVGTRVHARFPLLHTSPANNRGEGRRAR